MDNNGNMKMKEKKNGASAPPALSFNVVVVIAIRSNKIDDW